MNALLEAWYASRRNAYPWRGTRDPYRVLVSEVMLQQTQAPRVVPAYRAFLRRFPTVRALAAAPRAEVVRAWAGLGYNRRAVALSEAARSIVRDHRGRVPTDLEALRRLPGIGPYTAAAIASIAFGQPIPAIDTNLRRVVARVRLGEDGAGALDIDEAARRWIDRTDPGSWNQALMDVGREHCRPVPKCGACPLARTCAFRRGGRAPAAARRSQQAFEGSSRQLRGAIIRRLREGPSSISSLARVAGCSEGRVGHAIEALVRDGLIRASPGALRGDPRGRVRLR
jgi:A/G-specific adenine glycosylase